MRDIQVVDNYIDNNVILSHSWEGNILTLKKVFDKFKLGNITNLIKSNIYQTEITYRGYIREHRKISRLNDKIQDIMRYPTLNDIKKD